MSKTRKVLATLTMVAVTATASLSTVSSAQAHWNGLAHSHIIPSNPIIPGPGPIYNGPLFPIPPGLIPPPVPPAPPSAPPHNHGLNSGQAAALGLLGGVVIGALASRRRQAPAPAPAAVLPAAHYAFCDAKYRSYVIATNTFTGYDGQQHYCNSPYI